MTTRTPNHEDSTTSWTQSESLQMQIPHHQNRIPRICHHTRRTKNGQAKDTSDWRMERTNNSKGNTEFPGICQLLLAIHPGLQQNHNTLNQTHEKRDPVELG